MSRGLFTKLAVTNMKNSKQFYLPYILAGILTVGMFYIMCAMANNQGLALMPGGDSLKLILRLGTIVIGIFSVIFLFYTNSFIIKRRKKELGIYNILGMEKRHIAKILKKETIFTALISVGGGLISGIIFNKLVSMALCRLMGYETQVKFSVSVIGMGVSLLLFAGIYLLTYFYDLLQIKLANPIELLQGGNVGEKEPKTKAIMAILGFACLGVGYYIAVTTKSPLEALTLFFLAVILVIIGTYLIFTSGSIAVLKLLRKNKKYYYKTNHFTSVSGMIYRMKQNAVGLSNICILSTMVLVMVSTTVSLHMGVDDILKERYPQDIQISANYNEFPQDAAIQSKIKEVTERTAEESGRKIRYKEDYLSVSLSTQKQGDKFVLPKAGTKYIDMEDITVFTVMTAQDCEEKYNKKMPQLAEDEVVLISVKGNEYNEIMIDNCLYQVKENDRFDTEESESDFANVMESYYYLIVKDQTALQKVYETQAAAYGENASQLIYHYNLDTDGTRKEKVTFFETLQTNLSGEELGDITWYVQSLEVSRDDFNSSFGGFLFLGLFLGAMFLMITVLIIFYKQISEGYDDKERFAIMQKVGMSNREVRATIRSQILMVFFFPLAMAAIHVTFAFPMIKRLLMLFGLMDTVLFAKCMAGTILVFALIYLIVFLQTQRSYYRIVGKQVG